jgi:hypothetical protein
VYLIDVISVATASASQATEKGESARMYIISLPHQSGMRIVMLNQEATNSFSVFRFHYEFHLVIVDADIQNRHPVSGMAYARRS